MVEYAIMLGLIAVTSIFVVAALGHGVWHTYDAANTPILEATGPTDTGTGGGTTTTPPPTQTPAAHGHGKRPPTHPGNPGLGNGGNGKPVGNAPGGGN